MTMQGEHAGARKVTDYGAKPDGASLSTRAIQQAIDACGNDGGGTVVVPPGAYVTGSLSLRSRVALWIGAGARLLGSENFEDYPEVEVPLPGFPTPARHRSPLIAAMDAEDVALGGHGTIDGRGEVWWKAARESRYTIRRPHMIGFFNCRHVRLEGLTLLNSPAWTVHPVFCENVEVAALTLRNPPRAPNTDGINPESCRSVRISNCHLDVGDDCITIKSGAGEAARRSGRPCEKIAITNCTMEHGHGGVVIGSEMSAGVRDVVISNCVFSGTDRGIRLKSRRGRGGTVESLRVTNVIMERVQCPFVVNLYYYCGGGGHDDAVRDKAARPVTEETPTVRDLHLSHISVRDGLFAAGFLYGLPERPIENVSLDDVDIGMAADGPEGVPAMLDDFRPMRGEGFFCRNVRGLRLHNVAVRPARGPAFDIADSEGVVIDHAAAACALGAPK